jgi:transposase InsO family protein
LRPASHRAADAWLARPRRRSLPKDDGQRSAIAPNRLGREFSAERPNQRWIADFTYIWTAEGWLYVAADIDLFSRRVVGWSMKAEMTAGLVTDALMMAIWRRGKPDALLHHSGQGQPVCQRAVPEAHGRQRRHLLDEPLWQRLGQCRDGELVRCLARPFGSHR